VPSHSPPGLIQTYEMGCKQMTRWKSEKAAYDGVNVARASVESRANTEASVLDVAPVTPLVTDTLDTRATLVNNELGRESSVLKQGSESLEERRHFQVSVDPAKNNPR